MAVMMAREVWTDERLDDLANRMDMGFAEVKGEIREVRVEIDVLRSEVNQRLDSINQRFDSMQRTMILGFVTLFASIVASVIGGVFAALALA
jgi:tetrahydromethanopterin S-methyltransferase subunit G